MVDKIVRFEKSPHTVADTRRGGGGDCKAQFCQQDFV